MEVTSKFLENELDKNKLDKEISVAELENAKKRFAEELSGVSYRTIAIKPVKYKMPFKVRFNNWKSDIWYKIKVFLGL